MSFWRMRFPFFLRKYHFAADKITLSRLGVSHQSIHNVPSDDGNLRLELYRQNPVDVFVNTSA